jgi:hypothetical protein
VIRFWGTQYSDHTKEVREKEIPFGYNCHDPCVYPRANNGPGNTRIKIEISVLNLVKEKRRLRKEASVSHFPA